MVNNKIATVPDRMYFFDPEQLQGVRNIHPVYAPVEKRPVTFEGSQGWWVGTFCSSIVSRPEGGYRLYASARAKNGWKNKVSLWDSDDGLYWRPCPANGGSCTGEDNNVVTFSGIPGPQEFVCQPQVVPLRDGRWRMYFWKHGQGHLRYVAAESEDGLSWHVPDFHRAALYHPYDGGLWQEAEGLASHAGTKAQISAEQAEYRKARWSNDATYVYFNPVLDRYECYSVWIHPALPDRRVEVDNAPGIHRLIQRRLSEEGLQWTPPELIVMPDERDPWDIQFYYLAIQRYHDFLIGSLGHYRVEDGQQSMDIELCFSYDGVRWLRPLRSGFIPRATDEQSMDSVRVYAPNTWIDQGNAWLCLYTGYPSPHNSKDQRHGIFGAVFSKDRFVGLQAGSGGGGFTTQPFFLRQGHLTVNASIRGQLRAELCDGFGRKISGFHLNDSVPLTGDSEEHVLRWKEGQLEQLRYACLRLRLEFSDGEIFSVQL